MNTSKRYSPEVRERAVRMVLEHEVGGDRVDLAEVRVQIGDAAPLGQEGRARHGAA